MKATSGPAGTALGKQRPCRRHEGLFVSSSLSVENERILSSYTGCFYKFRKIIPDLTQAIRNSEEYSKSSRFILAYRKIGSNGAFNVILIDIGTVTQLPGPSRCKRPRGPDLYSTPFLLHHVLGKVYGAS